MLQILTTDKPAPFVLEKTILSYCIIMNTCNAPLSAAILQLMHYNSQISPCIGGHAPMSNSAESNLVFSPCFL